MTVQIVFTLTCRSNVPDVNTKVRIEFLVTFFLPFLFGPVYPAVSGVLMYDSGKYVHHMLQNSVSRHITPQRSLRLFNKLS
jgi:hypothetical protein